MKRLSRRDFLKIVSAVSAGSVAWQIFPSPWREMGKTSPGSANIIILVLDTLSARHLSLHGYPRQTTPNLERLAEQATVYHAHYSGANFTTGGTASILTGMYPWKHRALHYSSWVRRQAAPFNFFALLGREYYRYAFTQNVLADGLLRQFSEDLDERLPSTAFSLGGDDIPFDSWPPDQDLTLQVFQDHLFVLSTHVPASWLGGYLNSVNSLRKEPFYQRGVTGYPYGVPVYDQYNLAFTNRQVYEGILGEILNLEQSSTPYFAYIHLFSPHEPYNPHVKFTKMFLDGYRPPLKPRHPLGGSHSEENLLRKRLRYDQFIANVDEELGRLFDGLRRAGALDNSYLVITSDHGQLFERGYHGHGDDLMYEGVIHVPLLILSPGQTKRRDIYVPTSNVDLLPTFLSIAGREIPLDLEGRVLPGFPGASDEERPIYAIQAMSESAFLPLVKGTFVLRRGEYKLIAYKGFSEYDKEFELYDLSTDPEELNDIYAKDVTVARRMRDELLAALEDANRPFLKKGAS